MGGIFVNYRTDDGDFAATLITGVLAARFGAEHVFLASRTIRPGQDFADQILGWLGQCDAVLSGYMGDQGICAAILDAVARIRAANPAALYCCDPVIGDEGRDIYVRPGIPALLRDRAIREADIATPNAFELSELTGLSCRVLGEAKAAAARLQTMMRPGGIRTVLVTSLRTEETPASSIDLLAAESGGFFLLRTPLLPLSVNGAGDAMAALFLFHRMQSGSAAQALEAAGSSIFGLLRRTAEAGSRELLLVSAQEEFVRPSTILRSQPC